MDIRLEVLRIEGTWNVTDSGLNLVPFASEKAALGAAVKAALAYHQDTGGAATVHHWKGYTDTVVFDTDKSHADVTRTA